MKAALLTAVVMMFVSQAHAGKCFKCIRTPDGGLDCSQEVKCPTVSQDEQSPVAKLIELATPAAKSTHS